MHARTWLVCGALLAALDVALAAFGAHGLKETLERLVPEGVPVTAASQETNLTSTALSSGKPGAEMARDREIAKRLANFDTAVRYQMYHALALVALGLIALRHRSTWFTLAGWLFLAGIALFSGLLYGLVFSGPKTLGAIVPLGGIALIVGWLALAAGAWRASDSGADRLS